MSIRERFSCPTAPEPEQNSNGSRIRWSKPKFRWPQRAAPITREIVILLAAVFLYFFTRGLITGRETVAFANAGRVVEFERSIGLFVEDDLQGLIIGHGWLVDAVNGIYIYGHWPVIAATFLWLLFRHRPQYKRFRNAVLISGAVAFVFFVFFPTAPPRFLTELGFVDTVTEQTSSYRVLQPPALANQYAAVPSLHFGWNLLMGIAWATLGWSRLARLFGWLLPMLMFAAIVLTANHYIIDGIIGGALALFGLAVATALATGRAQTPAFDLAVNGFERLDHAGPPTTKLDSISAPSIPVPRSADDAEIRPGLQLGGDRTRSSSTPADGELPSDTY